MFLFYLVIGRLVVWFVSAAKPTQRLWHLFDECDLCLGVWVYFVLAAWLQPRPFDIVPYIPVAYEFVVALLASFVVHIFCIGWEARFNAVHD